ncbi:DUF6903 family protein [Vagococcus elongatus]|uniref:DUF6903 family protein n=1 Tax=Vagococcus elongatus TaxID=180344 RepID=UPI001477877D|nr:hypothetical protein [Vagococcus elongatus]
MNKRVLIIIKIISFFCFLYLVIRGQKYIGYSGLVSMLIGLAGLLMLMWDYNRKYQ